MAIIDVARARADTPGCTDHIHLNNAGAALMPAAVIDAMKAHIDLEARLGGYEAATEAGAALGGVYDSIATLIGAKPDEIALMGSASDAWASVFHATVLGLGLGEGDRILTATAEYCSNHIAMIQLGRRHGFSVEEVPDDESGQISLDALSAAIGPDVKLISLVHVPTNGGLVNPAADVGAIAKAAGIPFIVDAAQSVGQMPLDVNALGCDALVGLGRKFLRGPRGTAFLYVEDGFLDRLEPRSLNMKATRLIANDDYEIIGRAARFEIFEASVASQLGLGAAVDYALAWGLEAIEARITELAAGLRDRLGGIPGVTLRDKGARKCGIVTASLDAHDPVEVTAQLCAQGITPNVIPPTMAFFDSHARSLPALLRASVHIYNTEEELDRFAEVLEDCLTNTNK